MNIFTFSYTISCFLGFGEAGYAFDLNLIQPNNLMRYKLYHGFFYNRPLLSLLTALFSSFNFKIWSRNGWFCKYNEKTMATTSMEIWKTRFGKNYRWFGAKVSKQSSHYDVTDKHLKQKKLVKTCFSSRVWHWKTLHTFCYKCVTSPDTWLCQKFSKIYVAIIPFGLVWVICDNLFCLRPLYIRVDQRLWDRLSSKHFLSFENQDGSIRNHSEWFQNIQKDSEQFF